MGFTRVLAKGAVIEILQFRALSLAHHAHKLSQNILLITHFQFEKNLCTMLVRVREYEVKKKVMGGEIDSVFLRCRVIATKGGAGVVTKGGAVVVVKKSCGISDGVGDGVGIILDLKCDSKNCTRYRVRFKRCLKDVFLVNEHRMQQLLANNHWLNDRPFEYTTNKETRFVLYG